MSERKLRTTQCACVLAGVLNLFACHYVDSASADLDGGSAPTTKTEGVGVPECDDYLSKVRRCIDSRVPGDRKKAFEDNLDRTGNAWKTLAANSGARPGLPQACGLALQSTQNAMQQYACAW